MVRMQEPHLALLSSLVSNASIKTNYVMLTDEFWGSSAFLQSMRKGLPELSMVFTPGVQPLRYSSTGAIGPVLTRQSVPSLRDCTGASPSIYVLEQ
ncbi:hypothetical protein LTR16_008225 [Cryomyces antarcticus]|uniref:Uncharacterized protein n=1 Tax=Cryomyces antarcticus TaxID=329879 RepID=A0ABR0K392_9PEZI|nr:hypothetical protein LTR39_002886 [Cryomyces antarcticus]KAK5084169.1 hypothetical protein LTR16_008225 [Cryomyces antarcticus]